VEIEEFIDEDDLVFQGIGYPERLIFSKHDNCLNALYT